MDDEIIYDDIGFESGSYGDPTKLFDYDFSKLFDSFGGIDIPSITDTLCKIGRAHV